MYEMPYNNIGEAAKQVTESPSVWALAKNTVIDANYSLSSEITLRALSGLVDTVLMEKEQQQDPLFGVNPLHKVRKALDGLMQGPFGYLFEQNRNIETAMLISEIQGLVSALSRDTKNFYGHRSCVKTDIVMACLHAAVCDMLSFDDLTQEPVLHFPSTQYIRDEKTELLDDIYYKAARYVGISNSTSYLARKMYFANLNLMRSPSKELNDYAGLIEKLAWTIASRMEYKDGIEYVGDFFSENKPYTYSPLVADAIDVCANYYKNSNVDVFETAKKAYVPLV